MECTTLGFAFLEHVEVFVDTGTNVDTGDIAIANTKANSLFMMADFRNEVESPSNALFWSYPTYNFFQRTRLQENKQIKKTTLSICLIFSLIINLRVILLLLFMYMYTQIVVPKNEMHNPWLCLPRACWSFCWHRDKCWHRGHFQEQIMTQGYCSCFVSSLGFSS